MPKDPEAGKLALPARERWSRRKNARGVRILAVRLRFDFLLRPAFVDQLPSLDQFNRIVIKVGSSLLVDGTLGAVRHAWLKALASDIAALHERGASMVVVSSGAIALGRTIAGLPKGALKLEDSQASAAIGQIALASEWSRALAENGIVAGQVLLTLQDTEERRRYLNARATLGRLFCNPRDPDHQRERHGCDQRDPLRRQ